MKIWSVDVSINGENVLSIGSNWLSGKSELTLEDNRIIEEAAESLLSFLGKPLNKVVEAGQAECVLFKNRCVYDRVVLCGPKCECYTPAT